MFDKDVIKFQQTQILESIFTVPQLLPTFPPHKTGVLETSLLHGYKISGFALGSWGISLSILRRENP